MPTGTSGYPRRLQSCIRWVLERPRATTRRKVRITRPRHALRQAEPCLSGVDIRRVRGIKRSSDEFLVLRSRLLAVAWGLPSSVSLDESAEVSFTACSCSRDQPAAVCPASCTKKSGNCGRWISPTAVSAVSDTRTSEVPTSGRGHLTARGPKLITSQSKFEFRPHHLKPPFRNRETVGLYGGPASRDAGLFAF